MKRQLAEYAAKRSFNRTPEPQPQLAPERAGPLLFVVQKHAASRLHYDFRLELDGVLKSWAVPKGPSVTLGDRRMALEVEDHPFDYASFEGVIPAKQYGAGNVIVWDCGVYSPDDEGEYAFNDRGLAQERIRHALAAGKLNFYLRGEKLKGSFALVRTRTANQWLLLKHQDRFANQPGLLANHLSVLSGRSLENVAVDELRSRLAAVQLAPSGAAEKMPARLQPMLAETADEARSEPEWWYEPKLDGYRILAFVDGKEVRLTSRRGQDLTGAFPEIVAALEQQADSQMILDGELVALGPDGRPSFNALQNRAQAHTSGEVAVARAAAPAVMVCFDLLHFAGLNLRSAAYIDRRRYLSQCLMPTDCLQLIHVSQQAEPLYAAATESGFEGIVAKRKTGTYQPGKRSGAWLKIKRVRSAEFVVGGFTHGKGDRQALGAVLLGYWRDGRLHYAGHAGSGLTAPVIARLRAQSSKLARKNSPFIQKVPLHRPTQWVDPQIVVEVSYADWTADGMVRAPVFKRIRDDIAPASVTVTPSGAEFDRRKPLTGINSKHAAKTLAKRSAPRGSAQARADTEHYDLGAVLEQLANPATRLDLDLGSSRLRLSNLDRVYWPADPVSGTAALCKRDLIRYLTQVSPLMLPHLRNRPLTMIRMPEGIHGERFFQKHWEQSLPDFVETVSVYSGHREDAHRYLLANNLPTLLWLGQNGTLEFHIWHSRTEPGPDASSDATDFSSSPEALATSVLNYPDYLVFDIDPYIYSGKEAKGEEPELNARGFAVGRRVAFWLRQLLRQMSLDALVKTSGKTGLHIFVPIERTVTFDEARHICETVGRHLMKAHPREITMEWKVQKRTDKIFIDYNMNVRGKTLNVAYSPRGVPGAPVSMPLTWEELEAAQVMDFTLLSAPARLEKTGDRWQDALTEKYNLSRAFGRPSGQP